MWKNNFGRNGVKGVYVVYRVSGVNLDGLVNFAKKRGITLYDLKKRANKQLIVSVSLQESKKFFAIAKELCYNIKRIKYKGIGYPLFALLNVLPSVIGALIFIVLAYVGADTLLTLSFSGSGSVYSREVQSYLFNNGVRPFVRFSSLDLSRLEDSLLAEHPSLSFVSLTKRGTKLNVELISSTKTPSRLSGDVYELVAPIKGVVESIKVYRGTAEVKKGDQVEKGQLLVGGYALIKEQTVKINVLAYVVMQVDETFEFVSPNDNDIENAKLFALASLGDKEIINLTVEKTKREKQYVYTVTAYYRVVIYAG